VKGFNFYLKVDDTHRSLAQLVERWSLAGELTWAKLDHVVTVAAIR